MPRRERRHWTLVAPVAFAVYVAARVAFMVVQMFPWTGARAVGRWLGWLLRRVDRKHARIARRNLERAREVVPQGGADGFLGRVYEHVGLGLVELLMAPKLLAVGGLGRWVRLERFHVLDEALRRGRGAILAIGHLGNYELAGLAVAQAGYPLYSLARPVVNRRLDRYLTRCRTQTGQGILHLDRGLRDMVRVLRSNRVLVVQMDLDAKGSGIGVEFMGRRASAHRTPAVLSLKYSVPIIPANVFREGGVHRCVLADPLSPESFRDGPDPVPELTRRIVADLEGFVRAHPDQWLWLLDRWRSADRAGAMRSGEPAAPEKTVPPWS